MPRPDTYWCPIVQECSICDFDILEHIEARECGCGCGCDNLTCDQCRKICSNCLNIVCLRCLTKDPELGLICGKCREAEKEIHKIIEETLGDD